MKKKRVFAKTNEIKIIFFSMIIGVLAGLVSVLYRYALTNAEHISTEMYGFFGRNKSLLPILFIILIVMGLIVGLLVKKFHLISGSGIPQLKAEVTGYIKGNWFTTLVFKFIGGVVGILAGLSLGREGPSIQLGASVASGVTSKIKFTENEKRILLASGASAGLASAFNAPLAGVMFAIEEVFKYISNTVLLSTLVAAVCADFTSKLFFGSGFSFEFLIEEDIPIKHLWVLVVLGVAIGLLGVVYNVTLIKAQKIYAIIGEKIGIFKMTIPFLIAGILGLVFPVVMGGGHHVVEELSIQASLTLLIAIFVVKFLFSMISFGSGAPGGIFFPLLVLGALLGGIFAKICIPALGLDDNLFYNFVVIAMAAYFTAIVRAPMTGIVLMIEMTGNMRQLLPLIITSTIAYIVAEKTKNEPIYDALLHNLLHSKNFRRKVVTKEEVNFESVVQIGSAVIDRKIGESGIHSECEITMIKRNNKDIIPTDKTVIKPGDLLIITTTEEYEEEVRDNIDSITNEKKL